MSQNVILLDLENNLPTLTLLREVLEHYSAVYLFNCTGEFKFALDEVTEFAGLVSSGQVMILDIPETPHKEYEYAVLVGQLMALLEPDTHVELISAMDSSELLLQLLLSSDISCSLIQIQADDDAKATLTANITLPSIDTILAKPTLQLVKKYCDVLAKMSGKPTTLDGLKNSIINILHVVPEQAKHLVGMLLSLKIVKRYDEQITFRKQVLAQWFQLDLAQQAVETPKLAQAISTLQAAKLSANGEVPTAIQSAQQDLFKNFHKVDPVQLEVARKLRELQGNKPKDIYQLRDLLEQLFPKSDIRLLLKELIEKGYILWDGHDVFYSHEMFMN